MPFFQLLTVFVVGLSVCVADRDYDRRGYLTERRNNRYFRRNKQHIEDCKYNSQNGNPSRFEQETEYTDAPRDVFNDMKNKGVLITEYCDSGEQWLEWFDDASIYELLSEELQNENEECDSEDNSDNFRRLVILNNPEQRTEITGNPITSSPDKYLGKMRFQDATGTTYGCSATLVCNSCGTDNKAYIVTAGHCVNDGEGNWYSSKRFYPRINSFQTSISAIYTQQCWSFTGWTQDGDSNWDFALCKLQSSPNLGSSGFGYNTGLSSSSGSFTIRGYPVSKPYGSLWETSDSLSNTNDYSLYTDSTDTSGGVSGGPWHRDSNNVIYATHRGGLSGQWNRGIRINKYKYDWMCDKMVDRC